MTEMSERNAALWDRIASQLVIAHRDFAPIAAAPFLQGVKPDPWVDTRLVRFDDTIVFGHGGLDFDRWESMRWEMHTRHGSFAVWKSGSKTWSMYGGKYGFLMLDRFSSEAEAKAEAEQIVISLDAEPSPREQALEEAARKAQKSIAAILMLGGLDSDKWWDDLVSAQQSLATAIRTLSSQPVAGRCKAYVGEMQTSAGTDYFVMIKSGDRELSIRKHQHKHHADYEAAEYNWLFNGGEKPDILAYRTLPASPGASATRPTGGSNHGE